MDFTITLIIFTLFWLLIGGVLPWVIPKGPNRGLIQTMIIMTAVSCYMFWLVTALTQLNPLIGPNLENKTIFIMQQEWPV